MLLIIAFLLAVNVTVSTIAVWRSLTLASQVKRYVGAASVAAYSMGREHRATVTELRRVR